MQIYSLLVILLLDSTGSHGEENDSQLKEDSLNNGSEDSTTPLSRTLRHAISSSNNTLAGKRSLDEELQTVPDSTRTIKEVKGKWDEQNGVTRRSVEPPALNDYPLYLLSDQLSAHKPISNSTDSEIETSSKTETKKENAKKKAITPKTPHGKEESVHKKTVQSKDVLSDIGDANLESSGSGEEGESAQLVPIPIVAMLSNALAGQEPIVGEHPATPASAEQRSVTDSSGKPVDLTVVPNEASAAVVPSDPTVLLANNGKPLNGKSVEDATNGMIAELSKSVEKSIEPAVSAKLFEKQSSNDDKGSSDSPKQIPSATWQKFLAASPVAIPSGAFNSEDSEKKEADDKHYHDHGKDHSSHDHDNFDGIHRRHRFIGDPLRKYHGDNNEELRDPNDDDTETVDHNDANTRYHLRKTVKNGQQSLHFLTELHHGRHDAEDTELRHHSLHPGHRIEDELGTVHRRHGHNLERPRYADTVLLRHHFEGALDGDEEQRTPLRRLKALRGLTGAEDEDYKRHGHDRRPLHDFHERRVEAFHNGVKPSHHLHSLHEGQLGYAHRREQDERNPDDPSHLTDLGQHHLERLHQKYRVPYYHFDWNKEAPGNIRPMHEMHEVRHSLHGHLNLRPMHHRVINGHAHPYSKSLVDVPSNDTLTRNYHEFGNMRPLHAMHELHHRLHGHLNLRPMHHRVLNGHAHPYSKSIVDIPYANTLTRDYHEYGNFRPLHAMHELHHRLNGHLNLRPMHMGPHYHAIFGHDHAYARSDLGGREDGSYGKSLDPIGHAESGLGRRHFHHMHHLPGDGHHYEYRQHHDTDLDHGSRHYFHSDEHVEDEHNTDHSHHIGWHHRSNDKEDSIIPHASHHDDDYRYFSRENQPGDYPGYDNEMLSHGRDHLRNKPILACKKSLIVDNDAHNYSPIDCDEPPIGDVKPMKAKHEMLMGSEFKEIRKILSDDNPYDDNRNNYHKDYRLNKDYDNHDDAPAHHMPDDPDSFADDNVMHHGPSHDPLPFHRHHNLYNDDDGGEMSVHGNSDAHESEEEDSEEPAPGDSMLPDSYKEEERKMITSKIDKETSSLASMYSNAAATADQRQKPNINNYVQHDLPKLDGTLSKFNHVDDLMNQLPLDDGLSSEKRNKVLLDKLSNTEKQMKKKTITHDKSGTKRDSVPKKNKMKKKKFLIEIPLAPKTKIRKIAKISVSGKDPILSIDNKGQIFQKFVEPKKTAHLGIDSRGDIYQTVRNSGIRPYMHKVAHIYGADQPIKTQKHTVLALDHSGHLYRTLVKGNQAFDNPSQGERTNKLLTMTPADIDTLPGQRRSEDMTMQTKAEDMDDVLKSSAVSDRVPGVIKGRARTMNRMQYTPNVGLDTKIKSDLVKALPQNYATYVESDNKKTSNTIPDLVASGFITRKKPLNRIHDFPNGISHASEGIPLGSETMQQGSIKDRQNILPSVMSKPSPGDIQNTYMKTNTPRYSMDRNYATKGNINMNYDRPDTPVGLPYIPKESHKDAEEDNEEDEDEEPQEPQDFKAKSKIKDGPIVPLEDAPNNIDLTEQNNGVHTMSYRPHRMDTVHTEPDRHEESGGRDALSADSDTPSADSDAPSADSDAPSADSDAPSANSDAPSANSDAPSVDSDAPSANSDAPSADSDAPRADRQELETVDAEEKDTSEVDNLHDKENARIKNLLNDTEAHEITNPDRDEKVSQEGVGINNERDDTNSFEMEKYSAVDNAVNSIPQNVPPLASSYHNDKQLPASDHYANHEVTSSPVVQAQTQNTLVGNNDVLSGKDMLQQKVGYTQDQRNIEKLPHNVDTSRGVPTDESRNVAEGDLSGVRAAQESARLHDANINDVSHDLSNIGESVGQIKSNSKALDDAVSSEEQSWHKHENNVAGSRIQPEQFRSNVLPGTTTSLREPVPSIENSEQDAITKQITKEENAVQSLFGEISKEHKDQSSTEEEFLEKVIPLTGTGWGLGGKKRENVPARYENGRYYVDENASHRSKIYGSYQRTKNVSEDGKQNLTHTPSSLTMSNKNVSVWEHKARQHLPNNMSTDEENLTNKPTNSTKMDRIGTKKSEIVPKVELVDIDNESPSDIDAEEEKEYDEDDIDAREENDVPAAVEQKTENAAKKGFDASAAKEKNGEKYILIGKLEDFQKKSGTDIEIETDDGSTGGEENAEVKTIVGNNENTTEGSASVENVQTKPVIETANNRNDTMKRIGVLNSVVPAGIDDGDDADDYDDDDESDNGIKMAPNEEKENNKVTGSETEGQVDEKKNDGYVVLGKIIDFDQKKAAELDTLAHDSVMNGRYDFKDKIRKETGQIQHLYGTYLSHSNSTDRNLEERFLDKVIPLTQTTWQLDRRGVIRPTNSSSSKRGLKLAPDQLVVGEKRHILHGNSSDDDEDGTQKGHKRYMPLPSFGALKEHLNKHEPIPIQSYHDEPESHREHADDEDSYHHQRHIPDFHEDYEPFHGDEHKHAFHEDLEPYHHDNHGSHEDDEPYHRVDHEQRHYHNDSGGDGRDGDWGNHYDGEHDAPSFHGEHDAPSFHGDRGSDNNGDNTPPIHVGDAGHPVAPSGDMDGLPPGYREEEHKALDTRIHKEEDKLQDLFGEITENTKDDRDTEKIFLEKAIKLTGTPWGLEGKKQSVPVKQAHLKNRTGENAWQRNKIVSKKKKHDLKSRRSHLAHSPREDEKNFTSDSDANKRTFPEDDYLTHDSRHERNRHLSFFHNDSYDNRYDEEEGGRDRPVENEYYHSDEHHEPSHRDDDYHSDERQGASHRDDDYDGGRHDENVQATDSGMDSDGLPVDYKEAEQKALSSKVHREEDTIQDLFGSIAKNAKGDKDMENLFLEKALKLTSSPWDAGKKKHKIPLNRTESDAEKRTIVSPAPASEQKGFKNEIGNTKEKITKVVDESDTKLPEQILLDAENTQLGGKPVNNGEAVLLGDPKDGNDAKIVAMQEQQVGLADTPPALTRNDISSGDKSETEGSGHEPSDATKQNAQKEKEPLPEVKPDSESPSVAKSAVKATSAPSTGGEEPPAVVKVPDEASKTIKADESASNAVKVVDDASKSDKEATTKPNNETDLNHKSESAKMIEHKDTSGHDDDEEVVDFNHHARTMKHKPSQNNGSDEVNDEVVWENSPRHSFHHRNNDDDDDDDDDGDGKNVEEDDGKEDENGLPAGWLKNIATQSEKQAESKIRTNFNDKMFEATPNNPRGNSRQDDEEGDRMYEDNNNGYNHFGGRGYQMHRMRNRFMNNSDDSFGGWHRMSKNRNNFRNDSNNDFDLDCIDEGAEKCSNIAARMAANNMSVEEANALETPRIISNHMRHAKFKEPRNHSIHDAEHEMGMNPKNEHSLNKIIRGIEKLKEEHLTSPHHHANRFNRKHIHPKILTTEDRNILADQLLESYERKRKQALINEVRVDSRHVVKKYFNARRIDQKSNDEYQKINCMHPLDLKKRHLSKSPVDCRTLKKASGHKIMRIHHPRIHKGYSKRYHPHKKIHVSKDPFDMNADLAFTKKIINLAETPYGFNKKHEVPSKFNHHKGNIHKKHILLKPTERHKKTHISAFHMKVSAKRIKKNHHDFNEKHLIKSVIARGDGETKITRAKHDHIIRPIKKEIMIRKKVNETGSKRSDVEVHKLKKARRKLKTKMLQKELEMLKGKLNHLGQEVGKLDKAETKRYLIHMISEQFDSSPLHPNHHGEGEKDAIKSRIRRQVSTSASNSTNTSTPNVAATNESSLANQNLSNAANGSELHLNNTSEPLIGNNSNVNITKEAHRRIYINKYHRQPFNYPVGTNRPVSQFLLGGKARTSPFTNKDYTPHFSLFPEDNKLRDEKEGRYSSYKQGGLEDDDLTKTDHVVDSPEEFHDHNTYAYGKEDDDTDNHMSSGNKNYYHSAPPHDTFDSSEPIRHNKWDTFNKKFHDSDTHRHLDNDEYERGHSENKHFYESNPHENSDNEFDDRDRSENKNFHDSYPHADDSTYAKHAENKNFYSSPTHHHVDHEDAGGYNEWNTGSKNLHHLGDHGSYEHADPTNYEKWNSQSESPDRKHIDNEDSSVMSEHVNSPQHYETQYEPHIVKGSFTEKIEKPRYQNVDFLSEKHRPELLQDEIHYLKKTIDHAGKLGTQYENLPSEKAFNLHLQRSSAHEDSDMKHGHGNKIESFHTPSHRHEDSVEEIDHLDNRESVGPKHIYNSSDGEIDAVSNPRDHSVESELEKTSGKHYFSPDEHQGNGDQDQDYDHEENDHEEDHEEPETKNYEKNQQDQEVTEHTYEHVNEGENNDYHEPLHKNVDHYQKHPISDEAYPDAHQGGELKYHENLQGGILGHSKGQASHGQVLKNISNEDSEQMLENNVKSHFGIPDNAESGNMVGSTSKHVEESYQEPKQMYNSNEEYPVHENVESAGQSRSDYEQDLDRNLYDPRTKETSSFHEDEVPEDCEGNEKRCITKRPVKGVLHAQNTYGRKIVNAVSNIHPPAVSVTKQEQVIAHSPEEVHTTSSHYPTDSVVVDAHQKVAAENLHSADEIHTDTQLSPEDNEIDNPATGNNEALPALPQEDLASPEEIYNGIVGQGSMKIVKPKPSPINTQDQQKVYVIASNKHVKGVNEQPHDTGKYPFHYDVDQSGNVVQGHPQPHKAGQHLHTVHKPVANVAVNDELVSAVKVNKQVPPPNHHHGMIKENAHHIKNVRVQKPMISAPRQSAINPNIYDNVKSIHIKQNEINIPLDGQHSRKIHDKTHAHGGVRKVENHAHAVKPQHKTPNSGGGWFDHYDDKLHGSLDENNNDVDNVANRTESDIIGDQDLHNAENFHGKHTKIKTHVKKKPVAISDTNSITAVPDDYQENEITQLDKLANDEESKLKNLFGYVTERQKNHRLTEQTFLEVATNLTGTPWGLGKLQMAAKPCVVSDPSQDCTGKKNVVPSTINGRKEKEENIVKREVIDTDHGSESNQIKTPTFSRSHIQNKSMSHLLSVLGLVEKTHNAENADDGKLVGKGVSGSALVHKPEHPESSPGEKRYRPSYAEDGEPHDESSYDDTYSSRRDMSDSDASRDSPDYNDEGSDHNEGYEPDYTKNNNVHSNFHAYHPRDDDDDNDVDDRSKYNDDRSELTDPHSEEENKPALPAADVDIDGLPKGYQEEEHKDLNKRISKESNQLQHLFKHISFESKDARESERLFLEKVIPLTETSWGLSNRKHDVPKKKQNVSGSFEKRSFQKDVAASISREDRKMVHSALTNTSDLFTYAIPEISPLTKIRPGNENVAAIMSNNTVLSDHMSDGHHPLIMSARVPNRMKTPLASLHNAYNASFATQPLTDDSSQMIDDLSPISSIVPVEQPIHHQNIRTDKEVGAIHVTLPSELLPNSTGYIAHENEVAEENLSHPVVYKTKSQHSVKVLYATPNRVVAFHGIHGSHIPSLAREGDFVNRDADTHENSQSRHDIHTNSKQQAKQSLSENNFGKNMDDINDDSPHDMHSTGADELDYETDSPPNVHTRHDVEKKPNPTPNDRTANNKHEKDKSVENAVNSKTSLQKNNDISSNDHDYVDGGIIDEGSKGSPIFGSLLKQRFTKVNVDDDMRHNDTGDGIEVQLGNITSVEDEGQTASKKTLHAKRTKTKAKHHTKHITKRSYNNSVLEEIEPYLAHRRSNATTMLDASEVNPRDYAKVDRQISKNETEYIRSELQNGPVVFNDSLVYNDDNNIVMDEDGRAKITPSAKIEDDDDEEDTDSADERNQDNDAPIESKASNKHRLYAKNEDIDAIGEGAVKSHHHSAHKVHQDVPHRTEKDYTIKYAVKNAEAQEKPYRLEHSKTNLEKKFSQNKVAVENADDNLKKFDQERKKAEELAKSLRNQIKRIKALDKELEREYTYKTVHSRHDFVKNRYQPPLLPPNQRRDVNSNAKSDLHKPREEITREAHTSLQTHLNRMKVLDEELLHVLSHKNTLHSRHDVHPYSESQYGELPQEKTVARPTFIARTLSDKVQEFSNDEVAANSNKYVVKHYNQEKQLSADDEETRSNPAKNVVNDAQRYSIDEGQVLQDTNKQYAHNYGNRATKFIKDARRYESGTYKKRKSVEDRRYQGYHHDNEYNNDNGYHERKFVDNNVRYGTIHKDKKYINEASEYGVHRRHKLQETEAKAIHSNRYQHRKPIRIVRHHLMNKVIHVDEEGRPSVTANNSVHPFYSSNINDYVNTIMSNNTNRDEIDNEDNKQRDSIDNENKVEKSEKSGSGKYKEHYKFSKQRHDIADLNSHLRKMGTSEHDRRAHTYQVKYSNADAEPSPKSKNPHIHNPNRLHLQPSAVSKKHFLDEHTYRRGSKDVVKKYYNNRGYHDDNNDGYRPGKYTNAGYNHQNRHYIKDYNRIKNENNAAEGRHFNEQKWSGYSKDHPKLMNQDFIESLIPNKIKHLEALRLTHKVNKETKELQKLFNHIASHQERGPEERFIGEASHLVASKWGLNGDLGYKVKFPPAWKHDKNEYHRLVVNLNQTVPSHGVNHANTSDGKPNEYDGYKRTINGKGFGDKKAEEKNKYNNMAGSTKTNSDGLASKAGVKKDLVFNKFGLTGRYSENGELSITNGVDVDTQDTNKG